MEISLEANLYVDIGPKRLKVALSHCSFLCMSHDLGFHRFKCCFNRDRLRSLVT